MKILPVLCLLLFLSGCDCITDGNGVVVDSISGLPLDSVSAESYIDKINKDSFESEMTTDEFGVFYGSTGLTGGFFGCPDLIVKLSRVGYHDFAIKNPHNDTIRLSKR